MVKEYLLKTTFQSFKRGGRCNPGYSYKHKAVKGSLIVRRQRLRAFPCASSAKVTRRTLDLLELIPVVHALLAATPTLACVVKDGRRLVESTRCIAVGSKIEGQNARRPRGVKILGGVSFALFGKGRLLCAFAIGARYVKRLDLV